MKVVVNMAHPDGPVAVFSDGVATHRVTIINRVSLVYMLAKKLQADQATLRPPAVPGWEWDHRIRKGIWGSRAAKAQTANNLHVLVHRLRRELAGAGLDGSVIEKSNGYTRLAVVEVDLPSH